MAEVLTDIRQRHAEAWSESYYKATRRGLFSDAGANVRSGIEAQIVTGLPMADVDDMDPREVIALSGRLSDALLPYLKPLEKN